MTKKELEELVKRQSEQIAELTKMLAAMQMELQSRKCNDITDVMPKVYPQPYSPLTAPYSPTTVPLPWWWNHTMCGTNLAN
jgi:uncharacterized coiled-coil protein SlyX